MCKLLQLVDILNNSSDYSWEDTLFLPEDGNWSLNSICAVLNLDDLDDMEEVPGFALENGLQDVLGIQQIQDIVNNVKQQKSDCSSHDLFEALIYYYKNDAYLVF